MPVATTYPGVYIEEIPSGVHTLTGVATSITAFVGYTVRGAVNRAVHIFSFADFERAFGGLATDSPLSYCVKHFFDNGGNEAYIVRVAIGALAATASADNLNVGGAMVMGITAASEGTWGNNLEVDVDYDTSNPASLFNATVTEIVERNGQRVPGTVEIYRNLGMNSFDANYAIDAINAGSALVRVTRPAGLAFGAGTSTSGVMTLAGLDAFYTAPDRLTRNRIGFVLDGVGPLEFDLYTAAVPLNPANITVDTRMAEIAGRLQAGIIAATAPASVTVTYTAGDGFVVSTSATAGERSAIHFVPASRNDGVAGLRLDLAHGARDVDAAAQFRPARTGTVATLAAGTIGALNTPGRIQIAVTHGNDPAELGTVQLNLWGALSGPPVVAQPTNEVELLAAVRGALTRSTDPLIAGATATLVDHALRVLPSGADPNIWFAVQDVGGAPFPTATELNFVAANGENLARYAPGLGVVRFAQAATSPGNNGVGALAAPIAFEGQLRGSAAAKSGIYALEDVDIFNLLVMPDATLGAGMFSALTDAIAYCARRRAFMIIDAPETIATFAQAQAWIGGAAAPLRSRNSALYFPRLRAPDPMKNNVTGTFAAAGALAGLYARTDAERGVWKAPAGTSAFLAGATGLSYTLTDGENGTLNPLALNCLRTFPVYGSICWGARTGRGADALADEYKYVPVRRLALFLEESLYRGTQWAVFEPNDEPLWAQIRLNLGAFMHTLFAQGAFQGRTPREAYFVKCDKETTTQNDIDLGRVNIVVGFAPLKPAEFVIIQIQQIAGAIQT